MPFYKKIDSDLVQKNVKCVVANGIPSQVYFPLSKPKIVFVCFRNYVYINREQSQKYERKFFL